VCTRGVQITDALSPVQLNFVLWRPFFRHNYFRISPLIKRSAYQFMCTEGKAPINSDVHRCVLICESTAYKNLLDVILAGACNLEMARRFFLIVRLSYTSYFNVFCSSFECRLHQRIPNSSKIWEPPQNSGPGKGDVKQFQYWGLKNFRHNGNNLFVRGFYTLGIHICDVLLTAHLSIILVINQLNAQILVL